MLPCGDIVTALCFLLEVLEASGAGEGVASTRWWQSQQHMVVAAGPVWHCLRGPPKHGAQDGHPNSPLPEMALLATDHKTVAPDTA